MKTTSIKTIAGCVFVLFAMNSFGQAKKIVKDKVPTVVTESFIVDYPGATYESWYGYPAVVDDEWYGYDPYLYTESFPEYYVVEFTKDNASNKVFYSKSGKKLATHKKLTSDLPMAVSTALHKSVYGSWKLAKDKEEIFRDSDKDQLKVYMVEVTKGMDKHRLFFQHDGKLLKDTKLKS